MCRVREKSTSHSFTCSYLTILEPFGKDVVLSLMYIFGFFLERWWWQKKNQIAIDGLALEMLIQMKNVFKNMETY